MLRFAAVIACASALAGCGAGVQYIMDEYKGVEVQNFEVPNEDIYRIFDKPLANKLMITPSLGSTVAMGVVSGATFGAARADGPKPVLERASLGFLASTGRKCRIIDGYLLARPQWEFKYDCSLPPVQQPAPAARPRR